MILSQFHPGGHDIHTFLTSWITPDGGLRVSRAVASCDITVAPTKRPNAPGGTLYGAVPPDVDKGEVGIGGVEERRGGLGPVSITPFPLPAHQTGRADFPHPASRPASPQSTRRGAKMDPTSSDHTELPERDRIGETPGASRRHLVVGSAFALT